MDSAPPFVPAEIIRPAELSSVLGPALMITGPMYGGPILISEPSDHAFRCYLGKQYPFEVINEGDISHLSGGVIDNVKIELCFEGDAIEAGNAAKPGMFVQRGGHLFLCLSNHRSMYAGLFRFGPIPSPIEDVPTHLSIGFRNWRVVRWIGDERLVLWSTSGE